MVIKEEKQNGSNLIEINLTGKIIIFSLPEKQLIF